MFLWRFSESLVFFVLLQVSSAWAATYWASPTGTDANSCAAVSGTSDPKMYRTVPGAISCATSVGDKVYLKPGTYNVPQISNPPNGITIQGSDPAIANWPVWGSTTASRLIHWSQPRTQLTTIRYIFFDQNGNKAVAHNCISVDSGVSPHSLLLEHFKCRGPANRANTHETGSAIQPGNGSVWTVRHGEIWNWKMPDLGSGPGVHAFYWRGINGVVEHIHAHDNEGYAIQVYKGAGGNVVRYNLFENNGGPHGGGIFCCDGSNNLVHNNIVRGAASDGIKAQTGSNNKIYNNTLYNNRRDGIRILGSGFIVRNNIALANSGTQITSCGSGNTCQSNLTTGKSDDIFTDPAGGKLNLKAGSPAIDVGAKIGEITNDFVGTFRPQGCCYDIGAFEYADPATTPLVAPSNLQVTTQ